MSETSQLVRISVLISAITRVLRFFSEKLIYKAIDNFSPVFAWPYINTNGVGRILDSYANPRLRLGFTKRSRILPTPLVFISGNANTENVFYCFMLRPFERGCSNVCEAVPGSFFRAPNGLNELLEVRFEFPFILINKSTTAFLTDQPWRVLKPWYTGGGVEQGFRCCFVESLNQSLV